jgi:transposase
VVKIAYPAMLKAITANKKKYGRVDTQKISDLLRCNYFLECHIASREIRDRRRILRSRNLLVRQNTQTKNRVSGMLMETGIPYNTETASTGIIWASCCRSRPPSCPNLCLIY